MKKLHEKNILITGGTSGIGLATARLFKQEGARLLVTGRNNERIAAAQQALGRESLVVQSDAGRLSDIESLLAQTKQRFEALDVLFLNAGVASPTPLGQVSEALFDEVVEMNFKGAFFTIQGALPLLREGASIIVTTSIANKTGTPLCSLYGATKAAVRSMVQSLSLELIKKGIRINAISPGPIDTEGFNRLPVPPEVFKTIKDDIENRSPIRRLGTSEEVAKVALFLASDDSSYIVGEEIVVDGGITQVCLP